MLIVNYLDEFLTQARVAIDNALANAEIQDSPIAFGYTPEKMRGGRVLWERAQAATQQQIREYGERVGATAALKEAWEQAKTTYNPLAQVAPIAFKKKPAFLPNARSPAVVRSFGRCGALPV